MQGEGHGGHGRAGTSQMVLHPREGHGDGSRIGAEHVQSQQHRETAADNGPMFLLHRLISPQIISLCMHFVSKTDNAQILQLTLIYPLIIRQDAGRVH